MNDNTQIVNKIDVNAQKMIDEQKKSPAAPGKWERPGYLFGLL